MQRCIQLARNGRGTVSPNPMVGAVIVHKGRIIGEGWHQRAGFPHAEVNAINSVENQEFLQESCIYVSLEPCAHFGKTPPCSDLIIEKGIPKVVIGCRDPFAEVNGKGVEKLKAAGIEVIENVLQKQCEDLNKRFFTFHAYRRPYIILKWAQTADGFFDKHRSPDQKGINWITRPETKTLVHQWRTEEDAILVGANTVVNDNPSLTAREVAGKNPVRLVIAPTTTLPANAAIDDGAAETYVFSRVKQLLNKARWLECGKNPLQEILDFCYQNNLQSLIVEGGATLLRSFIEADLWDEARILSGNAFFEKGLKAPSLPKARRNYSTNIGEDRLNILYR